MIVRCVNRTPVFLMVEVSTDPLSENDIQKWEGYEQIKNFYCMPEKPIDFDKLSRARLRYWDMNRHLYDDSRLIQIDTHRPSDMGVERATPLQVEHSFKHWTIKHGPRDILLPPSGVINKETKCEERQTFLKDKAEGLVKAKRIAELEALVEKLSKTNEQKTKGVFSKQVSAKSSSVVVPTVVDNISSGKKRPLLADYGSPAFSLASPSAGSSASCPPPYYSYPPLVVGNPPPPPRVHVVSQHNASTATLPTIDNVTALPNHWAEELNRKSFEVTMKEKRVQALQLDIEAGRKELALRAQQQQRAKAQAQADLELQTIYANKQEVAHQAQKRQQFLHDQANALQNQQLSEDRLFMKEAIRRQWQFEDRETENQARRNQNRDAMDMATRANETAVLQSLLSAQKQSLPFPPQQFPPPYPTQPPPQFRYPPHPVFSHPPPPEYAAHTLTSPVVFPPMPPHQPTPPTTSSSSHHVTPAQKYGISVPETPPFKYHQEPTPPCPINIMYPEHQSFSIAGSIDESKSIEDLSADEIQQMLVNAQAQLNAELLDL